MKGKKTIFINSNYMDEADNLSTLCAVIDGGKVVAMDTPENLKTNLFEGVQLTSEIEIGQTDYPQLQTRLKNYSPDTVIDEEQTEGRYRISIPAKKKSKYSSSEVAELFNETRCYD
jgi:ABC-2 type transport system ATP-binding protein